MYGDIASEATTTVAAETNPTTTMFRQRYLNGNVAGRNASARQMPAVAPTPVLCLVSSNKPSATPSNIAAIVSLFPRAAQLR